MIDCVASLLDCPAGETGSVANVTQCIISRSDYLTDLASRNNDVPLG